MADILRAHRTFLLLILLVGCGSGQKPGADTTGAYIDRRMLATPPAIDAVDSVPLATPQDTVLPAFLAAGYQFGTTEQEIREILGEPDSINATPYQNEHDQTRTDTILRLYYATLTVSLYRRTEARGDILLHVILTGAGRPVPFGVGVGTSRAQVVATLGPTREGLDESGLETLEYQGPMDSPGVIRFHLRKDRVQSIEWTYFID